VKSAVLLASLLSAVVLPANSVALDLRPNILWIVIDDGNKRSSEAMPMTKTVVADRGVSIPNFVMTNPACAPSRASMLRGQYSHNHGVLTNADGYPTFRDTGSELDTIATRMELGGYHTMHFGKYLNLWGKGHGQDGHPGPPPGWSGKWVSTVVGNENSDAWFYYRLFQGTKETAFGPGDDRARSYEPSVVTNLALAGFKKAPKDKPFFAVVQMRPPHMPATPHPEVANLPPPKFNPPPSYDEAPALETLRKRFPALTTEQKKFIAKRMTNRYRSVRYVDKMIIKLLNELERSGRLANTYVFVFSDNGMMEGEKRMDVKGVPYEESLVAPLWVRGPGIAGGRVETRLAATHDLAPTALRLAQRVVPSFMDGRDISPLLFAQQKPWRTGVLGEFYGNPDWIALRTETKKYIIWKNGDREMYDLKDDPYERKNLAGQLAYAIDEERFAKQLKQLKTCGAPPRARCFRAEGP
jgi:N-acetylglucosamine-6-sulfatase